MGEIEPEADPAKIHFVFCSPMEAMHMVGNKHIHVQVGINITHPPQT